jgi:hypothetical protein
VKLDDSLNSTRHDSFILLSIHTYFLIGDELSGLRTSLLKSPEGHAIAEAVIHRLPVTVVQVRAQVSSYRICGGQNSTEVGFLRVSRFPVAILVPLPAPHSTSTIVRGWQNRSNSGRRTKWTQSHPTPRNLKKKKTGIGWMRRCMGT